MWRRPSARSRWSRRGHCARSSAASRPAFAAATWQRALGGRAVDDQLAESSRLQLGVRAEHADPQAPRVRSVGAAPTERCRPSQRKAAVGASAAPPIRSARPPTYSSRAAIRFSVSVPVLSAQTRVTEPERLGRAESADQRAVAAHAAGGQRQHAGGDGRQRLGDRRDAQ